MKKFKDNPLMQILVLLGLIIAIALFLYVDSQTLAPKRFTRRNEPLTDVKIPRQMDGVNILFFSDLEYGTYFKEDRLSSFCSAIVNTSPDVIVFGGDLLEGNARLDEEETAVLKRELSALKAPLGKFAVLGDNDHKNEETLALATDILESSGFEILHNQSILLHNKESQSVTLVGLDNGLNGNQDISAAYSNVSPNSFVITVCHTPDTAKKVPGDKTDYFLSGHSHGGQVYYIFGATYTPAMATEYLRGRHTINDRFTLDITNGVGTTGIDARFLSNAEFVLYTLHSAAPLPTPTPKPTPAPEDESEPEESTVPEESSEAPAEEAQEEPVEEVIPEEEPAEEPVEEEPAEEEPSEEAVEEETSEEETGEEEYSEESAESENP